MKNLLFAAAALVAIPAQASVLLPGNTSTFDGFNAATRGTLLAYTETSDTAGTFAAIFKTGVYRNTSGTIDFYHQVVRTGAGPLGNDEIVRFTIANYAGWSVETFRDGTDFDGPGGFLAANNPGVFTSGGTRSPGLGGVVGANFHAAAPFNGLIGTENSTTYIFRTNAPSFKAGTFGVLDGASIEGITFAPSVPEPATWAMMVGGFGLLGFAARRSRRATTVLA